MAIFFGRRPEEQYTRVPNQWARDPKLSLKAKGLLAYVLSHQDGYRLTVEQAVAESVGGKTAVYSAIRELVEHGYLRRDQRRGPGGKVGEVDYYVSDAPDVTASRFPASGKPESGRDLQERSVSPGGTASGFSASGETACGKSATKKTKYKKTKVQEDEEPSSPLPPADADAPPSNSTERGRKDETDPQTQRITALITLIANRRPDDRRWTPDKIRKAINDCLTDGKTLDQVERAFPLCATDPDTGSPGRLRLPFPWWDDEPDCGRCSGKHTIVGEYPDGNRQIPCPECRRAPLHNDKCDRHPRMPAWNCGTCRADRRANCPLPYHNDPANNCGTCWSHVRTRQDPYEGNEQLRPKGWFDIYGPTLKPAVTSTVTPITKTSRRPQRDTPTYPRRVRDSCDRTDCNRGFIRADPADLTANSSYCPTCFILSPADEPETACAS